MGKRKNHKGIQKISQDNKNENKTYQNLCDTAKAVLRGKFIVVNADIEKEDRKSATLLYIP